MGNHQRQSEDSVNIHSAYNNLIVKLNRHISAVFLNMSTLCIWNSVLQRDITSREMANRRVLIEEIDLP